MLKLKLQYFRPDAKSWLIGRSWFWERLKARVEGDDRGWDGWMASPSQWTWVWANSGRWWRTGRPGVLQSLGLQRVGHDWVTEQQLQQRFYSTPKIFPDGWFYCGNTGSTIISKLGAPRAGRTGNSIHGSVKLCISFWYRISLCKTEPRYMDALSMWLC